VERRTSTSSRRLRSSKLAKSRAKRDSSSLPALQILLTKTIDFLLAAGLSRTDSARELESQRNRLLKRNARLRTEAEVRIQREGQQLIEVSGVVHDWHRGEDYTDRQGEPISLNYDTLVALIGKRFPPSRTDAAVTWMLDNKVIRRNKDRRFELVRGRPVLLRGKVTQALALERAAAMVPQYLQIILRNAETADLNSREIERDARVLFLPEKYVSLWHSVARERTQAFLEGMDNWLEDHARADDAEPVREVGIHVHCYTGDLRAPKEVGP
jgi:hypothetical protein